MPFILKSGSCYLIILCNEDAHGLNYVQYFSSFFDVVERGLQVDSMFLRYKKKKESPLRLILKSCVLRAFTL